MSGVEQLREQLTVMGAALRAFDDPIVAQLPGLRLMHESLREREEHIANQIQKNETASLTLTLHGAARAGRALGVDTLMSVIAPVAAAVRAAAADHVSTWSVVPDAAVIAEAAELHLVEVTFEGDDATLLLTRNPGPLRVQLGDPESGAPIFEHAVAAVTQALAARTAPTPETLRDLAAWIISSGCVVGWSFEPYALEAADVTIDRMAAQQLLEAAAA